MERRLFDSASHYFRVPLTHVRYVGYRFHAGIGLSVSYEWQVLEDGIRQIREFNEQGPIENMPGPFSKPR